MRALAAPEAERVPQARARAERGPQRRQMEPATATFQAHLGISRTAVREECSDGLSPFRTAALRTLLSPPLRFMCFHQALIRCTRAGSGGLSDLDPFDRRLWRDFTAVCVLTPPSRHWLCECVSVSVCECVSARCKCAHISGRCTCALTESGPQHQQQSTCDTL
jgi:hypothetical protein